MARSATEPWLKAALAYLPQWMAYQIERHRQVGCTLAIAQDNKVIAEMAFGSADLSRNIRLTPRHRMRIASHSKSFTAAGIMKLREHGKIGLDDPIGKYVSGLHKDLSKARVSEALCHGAGVTRDGVDSGQFGDRRPYLSSAELRAALAVKQPLDPGIQLKYSNHGYGLLGLCIEEITGSSYTNWVKKEVIDAAGLKETVPDMPMLPKGAAMAKGHSSEWPFPKRLLIPGDNTCNAIAPAGGFVSTAADVARFFSQLAPGSKASFLSIASRREMSRPRLRDLHSTVEQHYGLGLMMTGQGHKHWYGHTGGFQGFVSRTSHFPSHGLTISVLCNANDGQPYAWVDGIHSLLNAFRLHGAPSKKTAAWAGRWWSIWGATDLVPAGDAVLAVSPAMMTPFDDSTTELKITGKDLGLVAKASAYNSPAQVVRRVRDSTGAPSEFWMGGSKMVTKDAMLKEVKALYREV